MGTFTDPSPGALIRFSLFSFFVFGVLGYLFYVLPVLLEVYEESGFELPAITRTVIGLSEGMRAMVILIVPLGAGIVVGGYFALVSLNAKHPIFCAALASLPFFLFVLLVLGSLVPYFA